MPHKVPTIRRYRISDDVLILILEKLNPVSLFWTCEAFERVRALVEDVQHLRFKLELAFIGMKEGPMPYACQPYHRNQLARAYRIDWPTLQWTHEQRVAAPGTTTSIGVSGGFLYYTTNQALFLTELPSFRTARIESQTRHLIYNTTPGADSILVDANLRLLVAAHFSSHNGHLVLKIRDLWTFQKHPSTRSPYHECVTNITQPIHEIIMSVCDSRLICTLRFTSGLYKHLLLDWKTHQVLWPEDQDVMLLNSYYLLGVKKHNNKVSLNLYNISNMDKVFIEREFELPPIWNNAAVRFVRNNSDHFNPSNALFYSDSSARLLMLTAKPEGSEAASTHWLFINESFFRPTPHEDRRIHWVSWSRFCLVKELKLGLLIGNPQLSNNRVVYLEKDGNRSGSGRPRKQLRIIDFPQCTNISAPSPKAWSHLGQLSTLRPRECQREFSFATTNALAVESIAMTDDNLVLFLENPSDVKPVVITTFGPTPHLNYKGTFR